MDSIENEGPGDRLRARRRELGISAETLASVAGLSVSAVRNQENGTNGIQAKTAKVYADELGVSPDWLLFGAGSAPPPSPAPKATHTQLTVDRSGRATLILNEKLPMAVALEILQMIEDSRGGAARVVGLPDAFVPTPEYLREELSKSGRSQSALGRAMGVNQSAVSRILTGERQIKAREIGAITEYLRETEGAKQP